MDLGAEFVRACGLAWLCFAWGVIVFQMDSHSRQGQYLSRLLILLAPGILTCFGWHSVRQYNVVLAQNRVPFSEVADNGGPVSYTHLTLPTKA